MDATELCYTPATRLAAAIRAKEISPVEVTEAVLARIERLNPTLNAYCTVTVDLARTTARAAEAAVMRGEVLGPLHGVPYSLKDLTPTRASAPPLDRRSLSTMCPQRTPSWSSGCVRLAASCSAKRTRRNLAAKVLPTTKSSVRPTTPGISNARRVVPAVVLAPQWLRGWDLWRRAATWPAPSVCRRAGAVS
jgi:Amidase